MWLTKIADTSCPCGSGKDSWWEHDARGIPLARVCSDCRAQKLKRYRKDVLTDSNYEADEPIDSDASLKQADTEKEVVKTTTPPEEKATPELDDMAKRRVELSKKLLSMKEALAKYEQELSADIKPLQAQIDAEEPALKAALGQLPDFLTMFEGWIVRLKTIKGYEKEKSGDILDRLEELTKETEPKIYALIRQLRGTKKFLTEVKPKDSIEVKLQSKLHRVGKEGMWERFKNWITKTFLPEWKEVEENLLEMQDLLGVANSQEAEGGMY